MNLSRHYIPATDVGVTKVKEKLGVDEKEKLPFANKTTVNFDLVYQSALDIIDFINKSEPFDGFCAFS
jgi:hypothetical protein